MKKSLAKISWPFTFLGRHWAYWFGVYQRRNSGLKCISIYIIKTGTDILKLKWISFIFYEGWKTKLMWVSIDIDMWMSKKSLVQHLIVTLKSAIIRWIYGARALLQGYSGHLHILPICHSLWLMVDLNTRPALLSPVPAVEINIWHWTSLLSSLPATQHTSRGQWDRWVRTGNLPPPLPPPPPISELALFWCRRFIKKTVCDVEKSDLTL